MRSLRAIVTALLLLCLPALAQPARVVFLGEEHTNEADHRAQLVALREVKASGRPLLIVAEMFTERAEADLRGWNLAEASPLAVDETVWKREWGHPYALYEPIFSWARAEKVQVQWLRPDPELTKRVREKGPVVAVPRIGEVMLGPLSYRQFMADIARHHGDGEPAVISEEMIDRFFVVQCFWDEFMAWRIAELAREHPDHTLAVLVGRGHLRPGEGIPWRLARRAPELTIQE